MGDFAGSVSRMAPVRRSLTESSLVPGVLIALAAAGWWWSVHMAGNMTTSHTMSVSMTPMSISLVAFVGGWVAMMSAMMFPTVVPVVLLFRRASTRGLAAPTTTFVAGYLLIWSTVAIPAYVAWRSLRGPIADNSPWAARVAGGVFVVAAVYQVSPFKTACLRHCRTPMSFFVRQKSDLRSVRGAMRAGVTHGFVCLGCCWALMSVLVALGTMNLVWMIALAALIFVEKVAATGEAIARIVAGLFALLGLVLLVYPSFMSSIT